MIFVECQFCHSVFPDCSATHVVTPKLENGLLELLCAFYTDIFASSLTAGETDQVNSRISYDLGANVSAPNEQRAECSRKTMLFQD